MDQAFEKLQKMNKNDVDSLIKWMKDSKVIDATKAQEEKARSHFNDISDKNNVTLDQFKGVITKLEGDLKTNFDGITKLLGENVPAALKDAISGAASAVTGGLKLGG